MNANKVSYCLNFRCHALVAVQGVEQRPQTIGNFNQVLVQLRSFPLTLTLESSSSNASVQPWRSSWASNTSATSEYCITIVPKKYFSLYLFVRHQTCEFRKKLFSLSGPRILQKSSLSGARQTRSEVKIPPHSSGLAWWHHDAPIYPRFHLVFVNLIYDHPILREL